MGTELGLYDIEGRKMGEEMELYEQQGEPLVPHENTGYLVATMDN